MTPRDVEIVYEALARTLDNTAAEKRDLFLSKLALLLAHELADADRVCRLIEEAAQNLDI
mgnify:FL=1|tara:strand:+ start:26 stop:205 length:180 start_codon:yes stop_codon:yes gene_type:complete